VREFNQKKNELCAATGFLNPSRGLLPRKAANIS
jgi:hypothetical protein